MVKLGKYLAYALFFVLALIYFMPKLSAYYLLESELQKFDVVISKENAVDNGFSLSVTDATLSVKGVDSATISSVDISALILSNTVMVKQIKLSSVASNFMPLNIDTVEISYSIFNPLSVVAHAVGGFGEADVIFDISASSIKADVKPSELMFKNYKATLKNLKKSENGGYIYEQNI